MRFTVLGSGTAFPDAERGPAGFLVQVGERAWLVDGGSGTLQRCLRAGVHPVELAGGFYSHRHPDHCADLAPLLFTFRVMGRPTDYPIWAGEGFAEWLERLRGAYGHWFDFAERGPVVTELSLSGPGEVEVDGLSVRTHPANHGAGALHLRFEADGAAVVFSGDTGPSEALVALARGADLLVCECGGELGDHLRPEEVAAIVDAARPAEVWLTHFYPTVDPEAAVATVGKTGVAVRRADDLDAWGP